jgi:cyclopropane-fatty-acyl-phospholipid synthase
VEIYQAFLDDPLMGGYTCGLWKHANDTLKQAQDHKWNNAIQRANITKEKHIIDIGSGWGYFPSYAHNRTGAKVTGITISQEQVDFSRLMYGHQAPNVNFELRDFRDLPKNTYDGAASVGVMAHVGTNLRPFLQSIYDSLKPGSIFHLEGIVMTDVYHKHEPWTRAKICKTTNFIVKYIFPQGCLLLRDWWIEAAEEIGFVLLYEERYGKHYARTLRNWRLNWEKNYPKLLAQDPKRFGDKFKFRMWQYYFAFCEAAFRVERIENVVLQLYKPVKVNSARWDNYRQFTVDPHTWPTNLKPEEPEKRRN